MYTYLGRCDTIADGLYERENRHCGDTDQTQSGRKCSKQGEELTLHLLTLERVLA